MPIVYPAGGGGGGGGGSGTVTSVSSPDTSIAVANPTTTPSLQLATLDVIAANEPPAADWSNNSKKITSVHDPVGAQDAATKAYADTKVASVTAGDTSVVVGGTAAAPTIATATLDVIAADHPPAAAVAMNAKKITGLANGTAASDAAAFGQIPTALPPNGSAGGDLAGTYPNPTVKAVTETSGPTDLVIGTITDGQFLKRVGGTLVSAAGGSGTVTSVTAGDTSVVVGGTAAAPTIATATLDVIAADHPPAADWSNNSHKITGLANGTAASDAAAFGQIPTFLPSTVVATADQTQSSNTVLTNDTFLSFTIGASATEQWFWEAFLVMNAANVTMDIKFGLTGPSGATARWGTFDSYSNQSGFNPVTTAATPLGALSIAQTLAIGGGAVQPLHIGGWILGGGTGGAVHPQWAQNTSDASSLIRRAGSFLRYFQVLS